MIAPFLAPLVAFGVSLGALAWMLKSQPAWLPLDIPNARSLHQRPVPRAGGLAILLGVIFAFAAFASPSMAWTGFALILATVSWFDDRIGVSTPIRLAIQFIVVSVFVWMVLEVDSWALRIVATIGIVWITNLFNFMDGSDGLAGGMATIGFAAYGGAAWLAGDNALSLMCASISAATIAFLIFNIPPARIFMGDVGSIPLGFLAATLGLYGWSQGVWPAWFPFLVFSLFIVDATVTLVRRALRGERVWEAHREHAYQKLVRSGWSHKRLAISAWTLMAASGLTALFLRKSACGAVLVFSLAVWILVYAVSLMLIEQKWRRSGTNPAVT